MNHRPPGTGLAALVRPQPRARRPSRRSSSTTAGYNSAGCGRDLQEGPFGETIPRPTPTRPAPRPTRRPRQNCPRSSRTCGTRRQTRSPPIGRSSCSTGSATRTPAGTARAYSISPRKLSAFPGLPPGRGHRPRGRRDHSSGDRRPAQPSLPLGHRRRLPTTRALGQERFADRPGILLLGPRPASGRHPTPAVLMQFSSQGRPGVPGHFPAALPPMTSTTRGLAIASHVA